MLSKKLKSELLVGSLDAIACMAYVSAIREVADAEHMEAFSFNRQSYEALATTIATMAEGIDGDFADAYGDVARRVLAYAQSL